MREKDKSFLFVLLGWDCVSELRPLTRLSFISQMIWIWSSGGIPGPVAALSEVQAFIAWTLIPWVQVPLKAWMLVLVYSSFTCHPLIDICAIVTVKASLNEVPTRWNDTDREEPKNSKRTLSQCHFVHNKCYLGANLDFRGRPNRLRYRTVEK
jgi:hypothetical protein